MGSTITCTAGALRMARALCLAAASLSCARLDAAPPEAGKPSAAAAPVEQKASRTIGIVLYPRFELLDVYGPAEIFGNVGPKLKVVMVAEKAGPVPSVQGPQVVADYGFDDCPPLDLLLVPGGFGTFAQLKNTSLMEWLQGRSAKAEIVTSVCSGSALLAKAGLLDGRRATSNKRDFQFAVDNGSKVEWVRGRDGSTMAIGSPPRGCRPASTWRCTWSSGYTAPRRPSRLPTAPNINGIATPTTTRSPSPRSDVADHPRRADRR